MSEEATKPNRWSAKSFLSGNGLIGIVAIVLVAMFVMKFVFPSTPSFAESGPPAPFNWSVQDARTGETINMSDYQGEVLVLNFWATWCPPCRLEKPAINRLHQAMEGEGLKVLAVSLQEDPATVKSYLDSSGYEVPTAIVHQSPPGGFEISAVPTTYVINRRGEIVMQQVGAFTGWDSAEMQAKFREMLAP